VPEGGAPKIRTTSREANSANSGRSSNAGNHRGRRDHFTHVVSQEGGGTSGNNFGYTFVWCFKMRTRMTVPHTFEQVYLP
jgi:hypothetical protein